MSISELHITELFIGLSIILTAVLSFFAKKINLWGSIIGILMAFVIWQGGKLPGLISLFLFFVFGSIVSSWKKAYKSQLQLEQSNHGRRGVSNIMANGGVAMFLCATALLFPTYQNVLIFMTISSFASACSDTFSSELGNVYGKKYFNITDFRSAERGKDGAVSVQGLWFGLVGSFLIAFGAYVFQGDLVTMMAITALGLFGNLIDSVLGATLQQKGYLNNHQVNFFATLSSALLALVYYLV